MIDSNTKGITPVTVCSMSDTKRRPDVWKAADSYAVVAAAATIAATAAVDVETE